MADNLRVILGGTTGAQDGTDVSEAGARTNPIEFTALNTEVDAHLRCDDGYWTAGEELTLPDELEVNFPSVGATWFGVADNPVAVPEIEDVNYPVKFRQVATVDVGSEADVFGADGSFNAITALSTPTLTATANGSSQIDLSCTNISNEDGYLFEWSPNGSTGWQTVEQTAANDTTCSHTGLNAGTQYFYRVKALGSGRYSDSGYGTDDAAPAAAPTTDTFYANAGGDGAVRAFGSGGGWFATARGAATGSDAYGGNTGHYSAYVDPPNGLISRGFYPFDTSALPDGATITAASLFVYSYVTPGTGGGGSTDNKSVCVVASTQASNTALTTADYDQVGSTLLADRIPFSSFPSAGYQEIPLNATGLAAISKTGYTKLALIAGYDFDNTAPVTDWCGFGSKFSDETGTTYDPYLEVTYTV